MKTKTLQKIKIIIIKQTIHVRLQRFLRFVSLTHSISKQLKTWVFFWGGGFNLLFEGAIAFIIY